MQFITLDMAKSYLRVDSSDEDQLIELLANSAEKLCIDVARLDLEELAELQNVETDDDGNVISAWSDAFSFDEIVRIRELMRIAVLYALGYLFEHREEADHHALLLVLRSLLFSIREGVI